MSVSRECARDEDTAPWCCYWALPWRVRDWWNQHTLVDAVDPQGGDSNA
jgi:hypothetical protein